MISLPPETLINSVVPFSCSLLAQHTWADGTPNSFFMPMWCVHMCPCGCACWKKQEVMATLLCPSVPSSREAESFTNPGGLLGNRQAPVICLCLPHNSVEAKGSCPAFYGDAGDSNRGPPPCPRSAFTQRVIAVVPGIPNSCLSTCGIWHIAKPESGHWGAVCSILSFPG